MEGSVREDQVWTWLGTYGLLEDNMVVSKMEPDEQHLEEQR